MDIKAGIVGVGSYVPVEDIKEFINEYSKKEEEASGDEE